MHSSRTICQSKVFLVFFLSLFSSPAPSITGPPVDRWLGRRAFSRRSHLGPRGARGARLPSLRRRRSLGCHGLWGPFRGSHCCLTVTHAGPSGSLQQPRRSSSNVGRDLEGAAKKLCFNMQRADGCCRGGASPNSSLKEEAVLRN